MMSQHWFFLCGSGQEGGVLPHPVSHDHLAVGCSGVCSGSEGGDGVAFQHWGRKSGGPNQLSVGCAPPAGGAMASTNLALENQLHSAQKNLLFLQQDHASTLKGLHAEIRRLQQQCTGQPLLPPQEIVPSVSTLPPAGSDDGVCSSFSRPDVRADSEELRPLRRVFVFSLFVPLRLHPLLVIPETNLLDVSLTS